MTRQREPVATRLSRHIVGMRDGIGQMRSDLFTVDQLAARSNFGPSGWQLFCARLRQHLIGQSKIIRRTSAAVTRSDPHTCCEQNVITGLKTQFSHAAALRLRLSNSFSWAVTRSSTMVVRSGLATGAGLEPAPPACAGALTVELPCISAAPATGSDNLDMSDGTGRFKASPMSDGTIHTEPSPGAVRMSDAVGQGVLRGRTGFCFLRSPRRGV